MKLTKEQYNEIDEFVENYSTKYPEGFIKSEIEDILTNKYPNINKNKFNETLTGITCMMSPENELIIYHIDIYHAIICGLENRDLSVSEWD